MKKFSMWVLLWLMVFSLMTFGETSEVTVTIPEYDVKVNGQLIDTEHSQYPVIRYKGITYFPMTSDYLTGIGLKLIFSKEEGLFIDKNDTAVFSELDQKYLGAKNVLGSHHQAQLVPFQVTVNGQIIDNKTEEYPILMYKNITYFPMTWRFSVTEFGWQTKWDNIQGFGIITIEQIESKVVIEAVDKIKEYIVIKNKSDESVNISGWRILSVKGEQDFVFPTYVLEAGGSVVVGDSDKNEHVKLHWLEGRGVWNNSESDPAELYDAEGELMDRLDD